MASNNVFQVMDPVHGSIELKDERGILRAIIDSEQFQRLRKVKQLGGACYVYPGANHTRFEHSIGVCYIASELMKHLMADPDSKKAYDDFQKKNENIDYETCVKVAALCHDLGHGPYSHLYDFALDKENKAGAENPEDSAHEHRSVRIFKKICEKIKEPPNIGEQYIIGKMITFSEDCKNESKGNRVKYLADKKNDLENQTHETDFYKRIISSSVRTINGEEFKIDPEGFFLFEIVANGFTEIDVDKMDYFIRDGHGLGLQSYFDWRRYIQTLKVIKVATLEGNRPVMRLCSRDKEANELYQLFHIRNQLYRKAYRHKTTVAVEHMLKKTLQSADKGLCLCKNSSDSDTTESWSLLEAWKNIDAFLKLNDSIEDIIESAHQLQTSPHQKGSWEFCLKVNVARQDIEKANEILKKIEKRDIMKLICWKTSKKDNFTEKFTVYNSQNPNGRLEGLAKEEKAEFHYGMKEYNPIQECYFYEKSASSSGGFTAKHPILDTTSKMHPTTFMETEYWYYYEKADDEEWNEDLKKRVKSAMDDMD